MALNPEVKAYLDDKQVDYEVIPHPRVFSTIDEALALGIEADEIAKTLVIHVTHLPEDQALPASCDSKSCRPPPWVAPP